MLDIFRKMFFGTLLFGCSYVGLSQTKVVADAIYTARYVGKDGPVLSRLASIQPHSNVSLEDISLDVWSNYDIDDKKFSEIDITMDYTAPIKDNISVSVGCIYFNYPAGSIGGSPINETLEYYVGIRNSGFVNSSLTLYHDIVESKGFLILGRLEKPINISGNLVTPSVMIGYNGKYFQDVPGFSHIRTGLDVEIPIDKGWAIYSSINNQFRLKDPLKNQLYGGVGVRCLLK